MEELSSSRQKLRRESNLKIKLRRIADSLFKQAVIKNKPICEVCEKEKTDTAHHFFPKSHYGHLRYSISNGVAICKSCHYKHHHLYCPEIHATIIKKRGIDWYNELEKESRKNPISYQTPEYYQSIIKYLKTLL